MTYRWLTEAGVQRRRQLLICLAVLRWLQPGVTTDHPEALPRDTYTLH